MPRSPRNAWSLEKHPSTICLIQSCAYTISQQMAAVMVQERSFLLQSEVVENHWSIACTICITSLLPRKATQHILKLQPCWSTTYGRHSTVYLSRMYSETWFSMKVLISFQMSIQTGPKIWCTSIFTVYRQGWKKTNWRCAFYTGEVFTPARQDALLERCSQ